MKEVRKLLTTLHKTKNALRKKGVIRTENITAELGEWLAGIAYRAKRATTATQRGWDLEENTGDGKSYLQVKTHAKGKGNGARWSRLKPDSFKYFDRLIIVVLSDDYFIKEWFDIPKDALQGMMSKSGDSWVVRWDDAKLYKKDIGGLLGGKSLLKFNMQ